MPYNWETHSNSTGSTYVTASPIEPELPSYLTYTISGYVWNTPSSFPNTAGVSISEVNELRSRIEELEKQLEEIKKRIGGGF